MQTDQTEIIVLNKLTIVIGYHKRHTHTYSKYKVGNFPENSNGIWKRNTMHKETKPSSQLGYQHTLYISSKKQLPLGKKFSSEREQIQLKR